MEGVEVLDTMEKCCSDLTQGREYVKENDKMKYLLPLRYGDREPHKNTGEIQKKAMVRECPITAASLERRTRGIEEESAFFQSEPREVHIKQKLQTLITMLYSVWRRNYLMTIE